MKKSSSRTAKLLRRNATREERILWARLRNRTLGGLKFRRQHPYGEYVLDFYCDEKRVSVELNGGGHGDPVQQKRDRRRDEYLDRERAIRIWNSRMRENVDGVMEQIARELGLTG